MKNRSLNIVQVIRDAFSHSRFRLQFYFEILLQQFSYITLSH